MFVILPEYIITELNGSLPYKAEIIVSLITVLLSMGTLWTHQESSEFSHNKVEWKYLILTDFNQEETDTFTLG